MEVLASLLSAAAGLAAAAGVAHHIRQATMSGNLGRNSAVGLRTRITKSSDAAWESGHRAAAPWLLACAYAGYSSSALTIVFAALVAAGGFSGVGPMIVPALGFGAVVTILAVATVIAHRAGKDAVHE